LGKGKKRKKFFTFFLKEKFKKKEGKVRVVVVSLAQWARESRKGGACSKLGGKRKEKKNPSFFQSASRPRREGGRRERGWKRKEKRGRISWGVSSFFREKEIKRSNGISRFTKVFKKRGEGGRSKEKERKISLFLFLLVQGGGGKEKKKGVKRLADSIS